MTVRARLWYAPYLLASSQAWGAWEAWEYSVIRDKDLIDFLNELIDFPEDLIGFLKDLIDFLMDSIDFLNE